ncbi:MAG: tetratricopeptide repeat protein [Patescibacteria group bacterium]
MQSQSQSSDAMAVTLRTISQYVLTIVFGLTPIFFIPSALAPFGYSKTLFVLFGIFVALIFFSLSVLRSGTINLAASRALVALWGVAGVALLSALFSGDSGDALVGEAFETQSALFLVLMALVATSAGMFIDNKVQLMRLYTLLAASTVLLGLFHLFRVFFGADFLSLGLFTSNVSSPLGGWNDLAIFFGLSILLSIVALEQLPLPKLGQGLFAAVVVVSLAMLAVINFFTIWLVLGLVSLVVLMYALTKDRFRPQSELMPTTAKGSTSLTATLSTMLVFVVSLIFVIGGSLLGNAVSNVTSISFVEVRPSFEATVDVAAATFGENAFLGIGPNKFSDAWRLYKDPAINSTIFWNTSFNAGSGYIPTFLVTTGIVGIVAWIAFLGLLLYTGFRMLFYTRQSDKFWYFIGSSSFVAAVFLWGMSIVYVPGSSILLLAAIFTGVTFVANSALMPGKALTISISTDRRAGFALVAGVMVVIVASVATLYFSGRHYVALYSFNDAIGSIQAGTQLEAVEQQIAEAFTLYESDTYARQIAGYQLARINTLLNLPEPTETQQQQFRDAIANGIRSAQVAVDIDGTDALNWATLGSVYSVLTVANIEGSAERAREAIAEARRLDPQNPEYLLIEAQIDSRTGDLEAARTKTAEAVRLKQDYTDALLFLTQLDIAAGNTTGAISTTQAVISLEPQNPARYYQLGVLHSANADIAAAIQAFEAAISLDQNYANARYLLALAYAEQGRDADAIAQLQIVRDLNPDNTVVDSLIAQLESGEGLPTPSQPGLISEPAPTTEDATVSTSPDTVPDTDLLTPVNVPPLADEDATAEIETPEASEVDEETVTETEEAG